MTAEQLISEGRLLERPCVFLRPKNDGPIAAIWHSRNEAEIAVTGYHCWITIDTRFVPELPKENVGFLSVFTDERQGRGGKVEIGSSLTKRPGIELHATKESVLPPIEAVFRKGSEAVGEWLLANNWPRDERYSPNFPESDIVDKYNAVWFREYPLYRQDDIYAVLGGWHFPCADEDWYELVDEQLMALTVQDSEPWVELWRLRNKQFSVIQRIT